jgi:hypothetical protein
VNNGESTYGVEVHPIAPLCSTRYPTYLAPIFRVTSRMQRPRSGVDIWRPGTRMIHRWCDTIVRSAGWPEHSPRN